MLNEKEFYEKIKMVKPGNYDMNVNEMRAIVNCSDGLFSVIGSAFKFGFLKGQRQAKAEMKKKAAKMV